MPENVVPVFFGQIQVEKNQSRARCIRIRVDRIKVSRGGVAVRNEAQVCFYSRARNSFADEKHVRFTVLDYKDLRNQSLRFMRGR